MPFAPFVPFGIGGVASAVLRAALMDQPRLMRKVEIQPPPIEPTSAMM